MLQRFYRCRKTGQPIESWYKLNNLFCDSCEDKHDISELEQLTEEYFLDLQYKKWALEFELVLQDRLWTQAFNTLVQLGVAPLIDTDCNMRHNKRIWEIITKTKQAREFLRRLFIADMRSTDLTQPGYGIVCNRQYAKDMLEHFLTPKPSSNWVRLDLPEVELPEKVGTLQRYVYVPGSRERSKSSVSAKYPDANKYVQDLS